MMPAMSIFSTRYLPTPFSSFNPPKVFVSKACSQLSTRPFNHSPNISTNLILSSDGINPTRRSGNYDPTKWDYEYIQSTQNHYAVRTLKFSLSLRVLHYITSFSNLHLY